MDIRDKQIDIIVVPNNETEKSESLWESIEKEYKSSERRYKLLAENVTDVIWTLDIDYKFTYISPSVVYMRGFTADEAMSQTLADTFSEPSYRSVLKVLNEDLAIEKSWNTDMLLSITVELDQFCKDGSIICTETKLTYLRDSNEVAIGFLGVTRDVTERKRIEEQLKHSELLASLGKMTAGIAHEVNNPLGSILLFSEMMMKSDVPFDVKKDLKVIHDEAKRAAKVMSDLLTYSAGGSNKVSTIDLLSILDKVIDMRMYAATVKNINVSAEFGNQPVFVLGDRTQLIQVFMNIMLNAEESLEEMHGGNISMISTITDEWVKVAVSDDGIGIPEENLNQVFYPFYTTKGIGEGTGLGLSTCYGIVTTHGGLIRAENNTRGGVTITVELPIIKY